MHDAQSTITCSCKVQSKWTTILSSLSYNSQVIEPFGNKYGHYKAFTGQCENVNTVEDTKDSRLIRFLIKKQIKKAGKRKSEGFQLD